MTCIDRGIIIYHTETKKDYDALIDDLDKKGYMWQSFMPLKIRDYWGFYQEKTCIGVRSEGKNVFCSSFSTLIHSHEIYKYEAKEDIEMKIYHTETQEDYDALMVELEEQGCKWQSGRKPTETTTNWKMNLSETCVKVDEKVVVYAKKSFYKEDCPDIPITKYKAKADEKMRFNKQNVEKVIDEYFLQADFEPCGDLIAEIHNLDDKPEKVVVPKFVAEWIEDCKSRGLGLSDLLNYWTSSVIPTEVIDFIEYDFTKMGCGHNEQELLAKAWIDGYTIEPEQLYYIPLPHLETSDGLQQVLSKRDTYFASRPNDKLKQRYTKAEIAQVPEIYKPYAKPIEEEE